MKSEVLSIKDLFEDKNRFSTPIFQRHYEWNTDNWERLWDSFYDQYNNHDSSNPSTFLGAIVLNKEEDNFKSQLYNIIDGQQRITTIFLSLAAIRDLNIDNYDLIKKINKIILLDQAKFHHDEHTERVKLSYRDENQFKSILSGLSIPSSFTNDVENCYKWFRAKFGETELNLNFGELSNSILDKHHVVCITLNKYDNPGQIFETLNSTGRSLDDIDLIRNLLLSGIKKEKVHHYYFNEWKPIEEKFVGNQKNFLNLIRFVLMSEGVQIKEKDVYRYFSKIYKNLLPDEKEDKIRRFLEKLRRYYNYYSYVSNPEIIQDRTGKIRSSLRRLKYIPNTKYYPLLLKSFDYCNYDRENKDSESLYKICKILETLYIRRYICGDSEKDYEKSFIEVCYQITKQPNIRIFDLLIEQLSKLLPPDCSFESKLQRTTLYSENSSNNLITKLILLSIEDNLSHKDSKFPYVSEDITIEHVMPQTLTKEWKQYLGDDWEDNHTHWCHTLGNLTLVSSKVQSKLSNGLYDYKKENFYRKSNFNLNKDFDKFQKWDVDAIKERAWDLTKIVIDIWPYFGNTGCSGHKIYETIISGDKPRSLCIKGETLTVSNWTQVYVITIYKLYFHEPDKINLLISKYPSYLSSEKNMIKNGKQIGELNIYHKPLSGIEKIYAQCQLFIKDIGWTNNEWNGEAIGKDGKTKYFA